MKKFLITMAIIFGILAVILYFASLNHLDSNSAKILGTDTTINIQGTVFCAACAIICVINLVGAIILSQLESNNDSSTQYSSGSQGSSSKNTALDSFAEETRKQDILKNGGWKCDCGRANFDYVSTCACGKNKREVLYNRSHPDSNANTDNIKKTIKKSENPDWIDDGDGFVKCPQCANRMTIDYINARKKCPECGCVYKS